MPCKTVFLDRDGTLNVDCGYIHRVDQWHFVDGAIDAVKLLRDLGYRVAVVTNQAGVAKELFTEDDVQRLHAHVHDQLATAGTRLDAFAICPHAANDGCECRKPKTGMLKQVEDGLGQAVDLAASWMIGDKPSDIDFGSALGIRTALIRSRYWQVDSLPVTPDLIVDSCYEAASMIVPGQLDGRGISER